MSDDSTPIEGTVEEPPKKKVGTRKGHRVKLTRQRLEASDRRIKAIALRRRGFTYDQIARMLGYADRSGAQRAVSQEMVRSVTEPAADLLKLELDRLDEIRTIFTPLMRKGDHKAAVVLLRTSQRFAKLTGLDDYERRLAEVAERKQALDESQAALMTQVVLDLIDRLRLTPEQHAIAQVEAPKLLRQITSG